METQKEVVIDSEESLQAAQLRYETILAEVQKVQAQLGDKDRRKLDGTQYQDGEYREWRNRAVGAMRFMLAEQRMLKSAIKEYNRLVHDSHLVEVGGGTDPLSLITRAHQLLVRLAGDGVDLDPDEQVVLDGLRLFIHQNTSTSVYKTAEVRKGKRT